MSLSIDRRADLWGDRTAVLDGDERVSYADLAAAADRTADRLAALGIGAGDTVAVISRNRAEILSLPFAVRRLGAALAPVSHRLTPATVDEPMERIDPELVVHEPAQRDLVRKFERTRSFEELRRVEPEEHEPSARRSTDPLLRFHTEDGERVVAYSERTVEWNCVTAVAGWGLGRHDCTPTLLPLSDPFGLLSLTLPLLYVGGRVVCERAFDPVDTLSAIERDGVTCAVAGATEFRELADADAGTDFSTVEWLATRTRVPPDMREALPVPLVRVYGGPETGPNVLREVPQFDGNGERTLRPFPDCDVRIDGEEVGELHARGRVVPGGDERAGEDDGEGGERDGWTRTVDLFRRDGDDYTLLGRHDEAFESGGERVHPRAVETVLESHPDVREAGVVEAADQTGGNAPKAVVVGDVNPGELREFAEERLASHEVPRAVEVTESLPRRASGELDRGVLRQRFGRR